MSNCVRYSFNIHREKEVKTYVKTKQNENDLPPGHTVSAKEVQFIGINSGGIRVRTMILFMW